MLLGWDPATNREVWRVPSNGGNGGTMATAGNLVFRGSGQMIMAHDAETGAELWSFDVGNGTATPVTYEIDGRQYVTILSGSNPPRVWTFGLGGNE